MITKKKNSIRAIDQGTLYDIPGKLKTLARNIEQNGEGIPCTDVVCCVRYRKPNGDIRAVGYHYGAGNKEVAHFLLKKIASQILND